MLYSFLQEIFVLAIFLMSPKLFADILQKRHSKQSMSTKTCLFQNTIVSFLNLKWNRKYPAIATIRHHTFTKQIHTYFCCVTNVRTIFHSFFFIPSNGHPSKGSVTWFLPSAQQCDALHGKTQSPYFLFVNKVNIPYHIFYHGSHKLFINLCLYSYSLGYIRGLCEVQY